MGWAFFGFTGHSEQWIRFSGKPNSDNSRVWLVVDLGFPVIDFVLLRHRQIALNAAFRVEEFNLGAAFYKAIRNL